MSDIQTLFDTDPLQLTDRDFEAIIAEYRKNRHAFNMGNAKAGSTKPKTEKQKAAEAIASKLDITI